MKKTMSDRYITGMFSAVMTSMYFIMAANSFFPLMLSHLGRTESQVAQVATVTSSVALIAPFLLGQLCDRFRLNKVLLMCGVFAAPVAYYTIQHTNSLALTMLFAGLNTGLCLNLQSIPAGWIVSLNDKGRNIKFGFIRSFGSLSFAIMSIVAGILIERYTMASLPVMMLVFAVLVAIPAAFLPKPEAVDRSKEEKISFLSTVKVLAGNRMYVILLLCNILLSIPGGAYFTFFPMFFEQLGGTESLLGIANFVLAVVEVPVMLWYYKLEKRFGVKALVTLAIFGYGIKNLCLGFANTTGVAILCLSLQAIGLALIIPANQSMTASCIPVKYSNTAQSLVYSFQSVGSILANLLCGWLVNYVSLWSLFRITSYFAFAGMVLFAVGVWLPTRKNRQ